MIKFTPGTEIREDLRERAEQIWQELPDRDMTGWLYPTPLTTPPQLNAQVLIVIGVGGSYLGARAIYEALKPDHGMVVLFSGTSFSTRELADTVQALGDRDFAINVISKSGTTRETALALDFWLDRLTNKYGEAEANKRVIATTGSTGTLRDLATAKNWQIYDLPENIGGRYSVLSPVGLVPLQLAGIDTAALLEGAAQDNHQLALDYAAWRTGLADTHTIEALAGFEPRLLGLIAWWQQLFGESEGKDHKGLFPVGLNYSADLHSMGQYMQDGRRTVIETLLEVEELYTDLSDRSLAEIERAQEAVMEAVVEAHSAGGVPVSRLRLERLDAFHLGELIMFFMQACATSATLQGVNPFDQPGVEAYKKSMSRRLEA
ncbi:glucose-6-phosphate isomerase [Candidatus Saccharibacteria bacterium]|nr:glucose-6-phosphate isomerase [Candidatus Saccharibacteria bacterium]